MLQNHKALIPDQKDFETGSLKGERKMRSLFQRNKIVTCAALLFVLLLYAKAARASTYTWNGPDNGSWNSAANWLPATGYPGSSTGDTAIINTSYININYAGNLTIASLQSVTLGVTGITIQFIGSTPSLNITSGLSIAQPLTAALGISFTGNGTLNVSGTATFNYRAGLAVASGATINFAPGSILNYNNSNGILSNSGTLTCDSCTLNFDGSIVNSGTLTLSNNALADFEGATSYIDNYGIVTIDSSTVKLGNNANYIQNSGSTSALTAVSSTFNVAGAFAYINNTTTFNATACTFNFGNSGFIENTGSTASFTTQGGCVFNLSSGISYVSNAGIFRDHGSTYTLTGQSAYIQNSGMGANMYMSGATINFSGGTGNSQILNNTATFKADSGSAISLNTFNSLLTNSGAFYAGTSGSVCIVNLNGQSSSVINAGLFYLAPTSIIYPTAVLANISNVGPGVFTLQSDSTGSAAIGPLNTTTGGFQASCTGTFNVERFFQGSTVYDATKHRWLARNYRILSSAVNTGSPVGGNNIVALNYIVGATAGLTTTANSTTNAFVTGAAGGSTSGGNPSLFLFRENRAVNNSSFTSGNFIGITDITSSAAMVTTDGGTSNIPVGNGVLFYFRGNATNWAAHTSSPFIAPENVTLTATGSINQQAVTVSDWYTPSSANLGYSSTTGNLAVQGFNLVGNPYPCSIDWNTINTGGITATNLNPTIYEFNPVTNQYDSYQSTGATTGASTGNASNIIASGQGFFVRANAANPALVFNETAKVPTAQPTGSNLLMGKPKSLDAYNQIIRLKLLIDSLNFDDIVIGFVSSATTKYSPNTDARYMQGINAPEGLASFSSDSVALSINFLPYPKLAPQVIRLHVAAANSGRFDLKTTEFANIPPIYEVWLMDNFKKDSLDIRHNSDYYFDVDKSDTTTFGNNRFTVLIRQSQALMVHLLSFNGAKVSAGAQLVWTTENEQNYTDFTIERSTDKGLTFNVLGAVSANGQGTYSFLDKDPLNGTDTYRLKIVDLDGSVTYSTAVTLIYGSQSIPASSVVSVFPNPATSVINLSVNAAQNQPAIATAPTTQRLTLEPVAGSASALYDIKIVNVQGALIKIANASGANWKTDVGALLPGSYIIQVVNDHDKKLIGQITFVKL